MSVLHSSTAAAVGTPHDGNGPVVDQAAVDDLFEFQHGVISRRQVLDADGSDADIERLVRRREWARVHDGVYVNHTGPLTSFQRAWAALLRHWPAALAGGWRSRPGGQPLRLLISSVAAGRTVCRSPTTPKSTSSKIGASSSLLTATMVFEVCMPARCWIAPEMPFAK